jgi:hypothetical protein
MEEHESCELLIYRKTCLADEECWITDCEPHSVSMHSPWFADAVGRAMLHRNAAIR